jgi:hypothetical protein
MANCEITIQIPDELAEIFSLKIPASEQPEFVAEALRLSLKSRLTPNEQAAREEMLIAACEAANSDPETRQIEREMAALPDTMTEEWNDSVKLPQAG